MADRLPTTWPIDPHTAAKHFILRRHLGGWFPIMSKWNHRLIYFDGFAGPGRHSGGEDGSPVVSLKVATKHILRLADRLEFYFVEVNPERADHLREVIREVLPNPPSNIRYTVLQGEFAREFTAFLNHEGLNIPPTFAFLDPFGFKGMPMDLVARLLRCDKCEVLITFMAKFINRFSESEYHEEALDEFFGTREWRGVHDITDPERRRRFFLDLYTDGLKTRVPGVHVRFFEMWDSFNQLLYYLIFATNSVRGMEVMKDAMWAVDKSGNYRFSDLTDPAQTTLLDILNEPAWQEPAARAVYEKFKGRTVPLSHVKDYVTIHLLPPFKKGILSRLKREGKILEVVVPGRGPPPRGGFPDNCLIRFA